MIRVTGVRCMMVLFAAPASAEPPTSMDEARKAFNKTLSTQNAKAMAELVGSGTLTAQRWGKNTRYKKKQILKTEKIWEDVSDQIPARVKCRKTTCSWIEEGDCSHADAKFKVKLKKHGKRFLLTYYSFKCK